MSVLPHSEKWPTSGPQVGCGPLTGQRGRSLIQGPVWDDGEQVDNKPRLDMIQGDVEAIRDQLTSQNPSMTPDLQPTQKEVS